jgi:hypothetical protein
MKFGYQTSGNAGVIWSDEPSFNAFPYIRRSLSLENTEGSLQSGLPGYKSKTRGRFCDGLGSNIMVQHSVRPIIVLHGRITARKYVDRLGNHVHSMIQTLFPNNVVDLKKPMASFAQLELLSHL